MSLIRPSLHAIAFAGSLLIASSGASAATLQLNKTAHSDAGGVFAVTQYGTLDVSHYDSSALYLATSGNKAVGFGTFCLEYSEPFNPGDIFDYTLASFANGGGVGGQTAPGQDPISIGTAWLYMQFATGNLDTAAANAGGSFSYASTADLRKLQKAFWFLEDEGQGSITNSYVQLTLGQFGNSLANAQAHANGAFGVSVLNLTKTVQKNGRDVVELKQSQLYFGGLPKQVPDEAATGLLLLATFAGLVTLRRRRGSRQA